MSFKESIAFSPKPNGLVRFPQNVETVTVEREGNWTWLIVARNDHELRVPLSPENCQHLAALLVDAEAAA